MLGSGKTKTPCPSCGQLLHPNSLIRHKKICGHTEEPRYRCALEGCKYRSHLSNNVITHYISKHTNQTPFACTLEGCNFNTKFQGSLIRHCRTVHMVMPADAGLRFNAVWNEFRWCVIDTAAEPTSTTGAASGLTTHVDSDTLDTTANAGTVTAVEVLYDEGNASGDQTAVQGVEERVRSPSVHAEDDEEIDELADDDFNSVPPPDAPRLADLLAKLKNKDTLKEDKVGPKENKCVRRLNMCPSPRQSSTASSTRSDPASASRWTPLVVEPGFSDAEEDSEDDSSDRDNTVRVAVVATAIATAIATGPAVDVGSGGAHQSSTNPNSAHGSLRPSACSSRASCRLGAQCSFRKQT